MQTASAGGIGMFFTRLVCKRVFHFGEVKFRSRAPAMTVAQTIMTENVA